MGGLYGGYMVMENGDHVSECNTRIKSTERWASHRMSSAAGESATRQRHAQLRPAAILIRPKKPVTSAYGDIGSSETDVQVGVG